MLVVDDVDVVLVLIDDVDDVDIVDVVDDEVEVEVDVLVDVDVVVVVVSQPEQVLAHCFATKSDAHRSAAKRRSHLACVKLFTL